MASSQEARASHILIKHEGSRRISSWRDPDGSRIKSTTREQAVAQLASIRDEILSGRANFADMANRYSDCSSARKGGDLVMKDIASKHHTNLRNRICNTNMCLQTTAWLRIAEDSAEEL
eukprot:TRINITY_DN438_c0_g1_i4.p1 TRINITY_DN438_c0_g1~~TRINITY_DN438_c0_g1_i4.p1  ORF type:complete len:119 (+),score=13.02 TRINITY_DN438_c0_g1_i4:240-596(+)